MMRASIMAISNHQKNEALEFRFFTCSPQWVQYRLSVATQELQFGHIIYPSGKPSPRLERESRRCCGCSHFLDRYVFTAFLRGMERVFTYREPNRISSAAAVHGSSSRRLMISAPRYPHIVWLALFMAKAYSSFASCSKLRKVCRREPP
jgi:hypothetical protein